MTSIATEIASSPTADITIYRTLVDGNFVLLHSKYQGDGRYRGPRSPSTCSALMAARSLSIGRQEPSASEPVGRTQVDDPPWSLIARRRRPIGLCTAYRQTVMVDLRFIASRSSLKSPTMRSTPRKSRWNCAAQRSHCERGEGGGSCTSRHAASWLR